MPSSKIKETRSEYNVTTCLHVCTHDVSLLDKNTYAIKNTAAPSAASGSWFRSKLQENSVFMSCEHNIQQSHNIISPSEMLQGSNTTRPIQHQAHKMTSRKTFGLQEPSIKCHLTI
jgi:hypothetical protein